MIRNERSQTMVINIAELRTRFAELTDRRWDQGRIYLLSYLLIVSLLAKLSGQHKSAGIAEWVRLRQMELLRVMAIHWPQALSLNTIRHTLANSVLANKLQTLCRQFLHDAYGGQQSELVTIDGKRCAAR